MGSGRIKRYICREILGPFGIALLVFTAILFLGRLLRLMDLVVDKGVPAGKVLQLFFFLLPSFLVYTLPLSFLVGIAAGFSRLSSDHEIIALKSAGVGFRTLLGPVLTVSFPIALVIGFCTLWAAPAGKTAFRTQLYQIAVNKATVAMQPGMFVSDFPGLVIYAENIDGKTGRMENLMVSDNRAKMEGSVILAERGRLASYGETNTLALRLENGTIHRLHPQQNSPDRRFVSFGRYELALSIAPGKTDFPAGTKPKEIRTRALLSAVHEKRSRYERQCLAELQRRLVMPLTPLYFGLIGVPLGIRQHRSGRGGGLALGLVVFLVYYMGLSLAETLTVESEVSPALTFWPLQLLFLGTGIWVFLRQRG